MKNLSKEELELLWDFHNFNRSQNQLNFLFNILEGDFDRLINLLNKIKEKFVGYCPGDLDEVKKIEKL